MTVTHREDLANRRVKLSIAIDTETWHKALADAYFENHAFFPVEGFAPGTASRQALEEAYAPDVLYQEAVNLTFPAALVEALSSQNLQIAGTPTLSVAEIGPDGYTFDAVVDLYPEVTLGQYKGLGAPFQQAELSNDDVENALADYCRAHVVQAEVDCAALGDEVTLDFEGFVDGEAFEGGKGDAFPLVLGSGMFIPGFEDQLVGIHAGEERDVHVIFPLAYTPELAGKQALFKVKAHKIVRRQMPELTEEFAVAQGFESLSALRCQVMETALQAKQNQAMDAFTQNLLDQVLACMSVTVPESMVESQLQGLLEELERAVMSQGMQLKDYLEAAQLTLEDLRSHARANAEKSARYELAMMEIARLENITVTEEEVQAKYAELSDMYGMSQQQIRAQLPPSRLSHDIKILRARAVVVDNAKRL